MSRQKADKNKYLAVFAMTTLIFIVGILLGNYFSEKKLDQVDHLGQNLKIDTLAMELQYELLAEDPCSHINNTPLAEDLYELASKLDYMEVGNSSRWSDVHIVDIVLDIIFHTFAAPCNQNHRTDDQDIEQ